MAAPGGSNVFSATARLHTAFSKPLYQRCFEVSKILSDTSIKELQQVFPLLLESIFGFNNQPGWGLINITRKQLQDFNAVKSLLEPEGAVFNLIWKLHSDSCLRYEFPIICLPPPTRCMLEEGVIPQLYINKLQIVQGQNGPHSMLTLNPFEYYMFHFSYLLINTSDQKVTVWSNPTDALYPSLVEAYLNYFLPTSGKAVPATPNYTPVRSPVNHHSPVYRQSPTSPTRRTPPKKGHHSLLKSSVLLSRSPSQQTSGAATILDQAENEMWRSEAVVQILTEFWLNQNSQEADKIIMSQQKLNQPVWLNARYSSRSNGFFNYIYDSFLPSGVHVRLVRLMVKHLHYFVSSASTAMMISQYNTVSISAMDDFKRMIWPQTAQKLYAFLKNCFCKWPLDSSFRLVLETWLSYIQPWRYQDPFDMHRETDTHKIKSVDVKWRTFIMENLLFYSNLFQEFLPRLFRMDLVSPRNAYMLFRVSKVFGLPGLKDMLHEAENILCEPVHQFSPSRHQSAQDLGASYLSMTQPHSGLSTPLLVQFAELEGPGFQYKLLFGDETRQMIAQLLVSIQQARSSADSIPLQAKDTSSTGLLRLLGFGSLVDYNAPSFVSSEVYDEFSEVDARKLGQHLDHATMNLSELFEVSQPEDGRKSVRWGSTAVENLSLSSSLLPDHIDSEDGMELTPLGRYQIINGLRKFDISYQGDPDLQPIRSFESAFLVRILHQLCWYFNHKFSKQITTYYNEDGFIGNLAYQFFHPPTAIPASRTKSPLTKRQMEWAKKPRLSLRPLASYQNLGYILAFYMYTYFWWGLSFVGFMFLLMICVFLYGVARSALTPRPKLKHS